MMYLAEVKEYVRATPELLVAVRSSLAYAGFV